MVRTKKRHARLTLRQYVRAMLDVAKTTFQAAPFAVVTQLVGTIVTSVLPIATTFYAALTTTALAEAFVGDPTAGTRAIEYVVVTAILGIFQMSWSSFENYLTQMMRYKIESRMTDRMYQRFLQLEFWRYDDKATADVYDKAQRFANFFPYIFDRLSGIVTSIFSALAGLIALIFVSWWLGLIVLIAVIPSIYFQMQLSRQRTDHWKKNVGTRRASNRIEWLFRPNAIAEIRLYGMGRYLLDLRQKYRDKDQKIQIDFERRSIWKQTLADAIQSVAEVVALLWVTLQIIHRAQPIGQFLYVQQMVSRALSGVGSIVSSISSIDEDIANLIDYQQFMALPLENSKAVVLPKPPGLIEFKQVTFSYPLADHPVLRDVDITIKRGEHIAFVGENGAGKTTLVKILTGLYQPTSGTVLIDGVPLSEIDPLSWHQVLGVLGQDFVKYDFANVRDNIYFGDSRQKFDDERYKGALRAAEADKFVKALKKGDHTYVDPWMEGDEGENGVGISGGQWQRLALARSFYRDAPIVVLDEPTSAVDALAESRIFKRLLGRCDKTIIMISHRFTTIRDADRIYMFEDGRVVETGTAKELVAKRDRFFRMFESQL